MTTQDSGSVTTSDLAGPNEASGGDNEAPTADRAEGLRAEEAPQAPPARPNSPGWSGAAEGGRSDDAPSAHDQPFDNPATQQAPTSDRGASKVARESETARDTSLVAEGEAQEYRSRWQEVQTAFVDEPRAAVEQADKLVAQLMQHLAGRFAEERSRLEAQWTSGSEVGTEELRQALQRYRSFFQRLLDQ